MRNHLNPLPASPANGGGVFSRELREIEMTVRERSRGIGRPTAMWQEAR